MLIRVDRRTRAAGGQQTCETRYFLTSIAPEAVSPKRLLSLIRGHWQIENSLHFVKDRWWDEDRHWLCRPGLAARCAALLGAALSFLRRTEAFPPGFPLRAPPTNWLPTPSWRSNSSEPPINDFANLLGPGAGDFRFWPGRGRM